MLPKYQDCLDLCQYRDSPFYETKLKIDGYNISLFNYRLATNNDFQRPFAKELRGICFVFNKDGSLFKRYILLDKFFNLNQNLETSFDIVKNYKIKAIHNKEDGSLATFIKLPNGKIVAKSKMGFDNDQSKAISNIYNRDNSIKELVNYCLDLEIVPVFEYVSPLNRIVLKYKVDELILLKLRCNLSGRYLDISDLPDRFNIIKKANLEDISYDLGELVQIVTNQVDREGVVVHCLKDDGKDFLFKVKTKWYVDLHTLRTEDLNRENTLIEYILDEKIDDIISQLDEEDIEVKSRINLISSLVKEEVKTISEEIENLYLEYLSMNSDRKEFAIKYLKSNIYTNLAFRRIKGENSFDIVTSYLRQETKKLSSAREWIRLRSDLEFKNIDIDD